MYMKKSKSKKAVKPVVHASAISLTSFKSKEKREVVKDENVLLGVRGMQAFSFEFDSNVCDIMTVTVKALPGEPRMCNVVTSTVTHGKK